MRLMQIFTLAIILVIAGCTTDEPTIYLVRLQVDGTEYIYQHPEPITVDRFLRDANVELSDLDRVYPELWTQISDEMRITVVRVSEEEYCEDEEIPFREQTQYAEGIQQAQTVQFGQNGLEEVCYRVMVENGVRQQAQQIRRRTIREPVDEIVFISPSTELDPVAVSGTLLYISNGNAWIIRGDSSRRRPLTTTGDLDGRVFAVSSDGRQLLFTRRTQDEATFNRLWYIPNTLVPTPEVIQLLPQDVLYADWVPSRPNTFSYSTAERQQSSPGWRAFNDLWIMSINPDTGAQIRIELILDQSSGGIAGWWGTDYEWSPDGTRLVWIRADGIGLVDLQEGELGSPLLRYEYFSPPAQDWSWRTTVSWSPQSDILLTTTHGAPVGNEPASSSPVFNISMVSADGQYSADVVQRVGIWSTPRFSPTTVNQQTNAVDGAIAYLQARQWDASINGEYDLVVADRDGSNARVIFPQRTQAGLRADQFAQDFTWSYEGGRIAFIYQGNLWLIDTATGTSYQITQDGRASKPVWSR
jgi:hypothetical protein